jgi:hypothetical protein
MPKKMNVGGISNELESSAFFVRRNTKREVIDETSNNDVATSQEKKNQKLIKTSENTVKKTVNFNSNATSQYDVAMSKENNSKPISVEGKENQKADVTSDNDVTTSLVADKTVLETKPKDELKKTEDINVKATSKPDVTTSQKIVEANTNTIDNERENIIIEKSKFAQHTKLKARENRLTDTTSRHDDTTSQINTQVSKSRNKKAIEEEKLKAVIEMILEIATVPFTTPVRMSVEEKREIEDYVTIKLRKKGIPKTKISISKVMRICTLYMMKVHEEELTDVLVKTIKNRGILKF